MGHQIKYVSMTDHSILTMIKSLNIAFRYTSCSAVYQFWMIL